MNIRFLAAAGLAMTAAPAAACLPPPPGMTETEAIRPGVEASTDIVYGVVTKGAREGRLARFKVLHVYKGTLKPGDFVRAVPSWGFAPPSCWGGTIHAPPPRARKGQYGVILFHSTRPALNFVSNYHLGLMFKEKWIVSAREAPSP